MRFISIPFCKVEICEEGQYKSPSKRMVIYIGSLVGLEHRSSPHYTTQDNWILLWTVAVPGRSGAYHNKLASCRSLPLAQVAPPAPGGAPFAPYLLRHAQLVSDKQLTCRSLAQMRQWKPKRTPPIWVVFLLAPLVGLEPTTCGLTVNEIFRPLIL